MWCDPGGDYAPGAYRRSEASLAQGIMRGLQVERIYERGWEMKIYRCKNCENRCWYLTDNTWDISKHQFGCKNPKLELVTKDNDRACLVLTDKKLHENDKFPEEGDGK